jgi:hypothetical protein
MQVRAAIFSILLAACASSPPPPSPAAAKAPAATTVESTGPGGPHDDKRKSKCAQVQYVFKVMYSGAAGPLSPFHTADDAAKADYERAAAATEDPHAAALHFLDCAKRYRVVPDGDSSWAIAKANAEVCYYDTIYAFANASHFADEGKALLEQAATEDPRLASYINGQLEHPPTECRH